MDLGSYDHNSINPSSSHQYLLPRLISILKSSHVTSDQRVLDLGAGTGSIASSLTELGFDITAVEPSLSGIQIAQSSYPALNIVQASGYDDLAASLGTFDVIYSLEVIEHLSPT